MVHYVDPVWDRCSSLCMKKQFGFCKICLSDAWGKVCLFWPALGKNQVQFCYLLLYTQFFIFIILPFAHIVIFSSIRIPRLRFKAMTFTSWRAQLYCSVVHQQVSLRISTPFIEWQSDRTSPGNVLVETHHNKELPLIYTHLELRWLANEQWPRHNVDFMPIFPPMNAIITNP